MANRILLGNDGSTYVLKVSQPGDNVLSPSEPLLFDSTGARSGMTFAGGNNASTTGVNWAATKGNLGYIPLIVSMTETSTTHIIPAKFGSPSANGAVSSNPRTATNFKFFVLRIPLQYGKMTDASLWS